MRTASRTFAILTLAALLASVGASAAPQPSPVLEVAPLPSGAPIIITPISATRQPSSTSSVMRLAFRLANDSKVDIHLVELQADVFARNGEPKGFYGFTVRETLPPGVEKLITRRAPEHHLEAGDRVVLTVRRVEGANTAWATEPVASSNHFDADPFFEELQELNGRPATRVLDCDTRCFNHETRCDTRCPCGVKTFSCTCTEGGSINYTCTCETCPV